MAVPYGGVIPAVPDRGAIDNYLNNIQGQYGAGDVNAIADRLANNSGGVSYQELQARLNSGIGGGGGGGGASVSSGPSIDRNAIAGYDQSIGQANAALGRLGAQLNSGYSGIDASTSDALNKLLAGKNLAEKGYNDNTLSTKNSFVAGKNTIGANAGQQLNSIQRLLGSRGAGGSSAATVTAPNAIARQSTLQRGDLTQNFGHNIQSLDQNWGQYQQDYGNQVSGVNSQKEQQRQALEQSIGQNRANLLQQLATLSGQRAAAAGGNPTGAAQPYLDQASSVLNGLANYTVKPIDYKVNAYQAPDLSKYTTEPGPAATYQGQGQTSDYFTPALSALLGKKQQTNTAAAAPVPA